MLGKQNIELSAQAIQALGKLGDYAAIGYLRGLRNVTWGKYEEDSSTLRIPTEARNVPEIANAIDQAITEIRSRLTSSP